LHCHCNFCIGLATLCWWLSPTGIFVLTVVKANNGNNKMKIYSIILLLALGLFRVRALLPIAKTVNSVDVSGGVFGSKTTSLRPVTLRFSAADDTSSTDQQPTAAFPFPYNQVVKKVAVAGATGRTGKLVVKELLNRNVQVVALVRSLDTATEQLINMTSNTNLAIQQCDLTDDGALNKVLDGCDAAVWCATGFSDAPSTSILCRRWNEV
jgi:hypothetical protein